MKVSNNIGYCIFRSRSKDNATPWRKAQITLPLVSDAGKMNRLFCGKPPERNRGDDADSPTLSCGIDANKRLFDQG
jgi:hypothetical protein